MYSLSSTAYFGRFSHHDLDIKNENKTKYMNCKRKETQLNKLIVDRKHIDQVRSISYLGAIVNRNNTLEEKIREITAKPLFKINVVSRISKLELYWSVIRPIVTKLLN